MSGVKGMKGSGGSRPNAGGYRETGKTVKDIFGETAPKVPQRAPPQTYELDSDDEIKFLESVMKDNDIDIKVRMDAAKNLARLKAKNKSLGKKDQLKSDAKDLSSGRFGSRPAPNAPTANPIAAPVEEDDSNTPTYVFGKTKKSCA